MENGLMRRMVLRLISTICEHYSDVSGVWRWNFLIPAIIARRMIGSMDVAKSAAIKGPSSNAMGPFSATTDNLGTRVPTHTKTIVLGNNPICVVHRNVLAGTMLVAPDT